MVDLDLIVLFLKRVNGLIEKLLRYIFAQQPLDGSLISLLEIKM